MNSDIIIFVLFFITIAGLAGVIFYIKKIALSSKNTSQDQTGFGLLKQDLEAIKKEIQESRERNLESMERQLGESRRHTEKQLGESRQIVRDVTERLTRLDETNKQVIGFAEQLQSLENILKNPKQRGNLGEYTLELLLERSFSPKQYGRQYQFKNGEAVDFALFIGEKILPIDSKFSLETYNKIIQEK
ncbi:MAG: DNA recombination protein RmuC, partial [Patescibacteria group bacterium]